MTGKSLIITGAGSGIGAATARLAGQRGLRVTIADVNEAGGEAVAAEIRASGGDAQFVRTDIAVEADVENLVERAVERYGRLDLAFNNAGINGYSHTGGRSLHLFGDMPVDAFRRATDINVIGTFLCMRAEIRAMLKSGGGAIVNTSSNAGILAILGGADYVATKHAVIGLTKAAALDYAQQNIRVNAVLPGVTRTEVVDALLESDPALREWARTVQPIGRLGTPSEIAEAALWLLSDAASFVTGVSLSADGGYSMT